MDVKSRQATNTEATRRALVAAARQLFGARGYAAVSVEEIASRARVTTGALYHHFPGKRGLFRTVFEQVDRELAEQIAAEAASRSDPWERLIAGCDAFLEACRDADVRQVVLVDAPSVLGWEEWREIDAGYGLALVMQALREGMEAGALEQRPVEPLAYLLYGAMNEAGLMLARAEDFDAARQEMRELLTDLLAGLRADQG